MNIQSNSVRKLGVAAVASMALLAFTLNVNLKPAGITAAGTRAPVAIELSIGAKAHAFDPVSWVWDKFKNGVLDKVVGFIKAPIEAAKKGLQSLIDKAIAAVKDLFMKHVLQPALTAALEKIFPNAEKILNYAKQLVGKVDQWVAVADKYAGAVDAMIMGNAQKYSSIVGEASSSLDVMQKLNVSMVVDILIEVGKEKAGDFIRSKTVALLNKAFSIIETPINAGKAAACSAIGSIPIVGGLLRGAADFIITQGLVLLRDKGFEYVADQAVKLADMAIDAIGKQLKGVAAKVDTAIAPILDKVKGFVAKVAGFIAPMRAAFDKVKAGLKSAGNVVGKLKAVAQAGAAGGKISLGALKNAVQPDAAEGAEAPAEGGEAADGEAPAAEGDAPPEGGDAPAEAGAEAPAAEAAPAGE